MSIEGAAKNLQAEIPAWDFEAVVRQTGKSWTDALSAIDASFSQQSTEETFYSNVYHGLVAPATYNDGDGAYRGQDGQNHPNPGFTKHTTLSIWDIYRGEFPCITLTQRAVLTTSSAPSCSTISSLASTLCLCGLCGATKPGA